MNTSTKICFATIAIAVFVARLIPDPERTSHGFGDLFHSTDDPLAAQMRILPGADEYHFTIVETQGEHCHGDFDSNPCAPPYHYHTIQEETFEVKKGAMKFRLNDELITLRKGDKPITVERGQHHTFIKESNDDLEVEITLRPNPGRNGQRFFPNLFGTLRDKPSLPQVLYIFCVNGVRLADIPYVIHEFMCFTTRAVAPLLGYRHEYPEYAWKEE